MWYNEERPHNFDEVKGQDIIVKGIRSQSMRNKFFPVYIFGGQYGGGKTTMGRIVSLAANCNHKDEQGNPCLECDTCKSILEERCQDVVEMDGASNTSVDDIRNIKESINYLPTEASKKVYIIDEVHMLSKGAFNALLKLLEETPEHVIMILCTTDVKMIPATVKSRAAKYTFLPIHQDVIRNHIIHVAKKHNVKIDELASVLLAKNSNGSMRDALSLLEQAAQQPSELITEGIVKEMLGIADVSQLFEIINNIFTGNVGEVLKNIEHFMSLGKEPFIMVSDMLDILADAIIGYYQGTENICNSQQYIENLSQFLKGIDVDSIYSVMNGLMDIRDELKRMPGSTTLVCGVIRMLSDEKGAYAKMAQKVAELEKTIKLLSEGVKISTTSNAYNQSIEEVPKKEEEVNSEILSVENQEFEETTTENLPIAETQEPSDSIDESEQGNIEPEQTPIIEEQDIEESTHTQELSVSVNECEVAVSTEESIIVENKEQEEVKEQEEESNNLVVSQEEDTSVVSTSTDECDVLDIDDPFAILNMFSSFSTPSTSSVEETRDEDKGNTNDTDAIDYDAYFLELYRDPVIENALEIGCERRYEGNVLYFKTECEEIYNLIKAYDSTRKFPFKYELSA